MVIFYIHLAQVWMTSQGARDTLCSHLNANWNCTVIYFRDFIGPRGIKDFTEQTSHWPLKEICQRDCATDTRSRQKWSKTEKEQRRKGHSRKLGEQMGLHLAERSCCYILICWLICGIFSKDCLLHLNRNDLNRAECFAFTLKFNLLKVQNASNSKHQLFMAQSHLGKRRREMYSVYGKLLYATARNKKWNEKEYNAYLQKMCLGVPFVSQWL